MRDVPSTFRSARRVAAGILIAMAIAGCAKPAADETPTAPTATTVAKDAASDAPSVESKASAHGTTITARAEPSKVDVGLPITLTLVLETDGATPLMNALDGAVPETLGDFHAEPIVAPRVQGSQLIAQFRLTTFASGAVSIPPIVVAVGSEARGTTVATEPLAVEVTSLLSDKDGDPSQFRDIKGELDLLPKPAQWPWIAGGATGVVVLAIAAVVLVRRYRTGHGPKRADAVALGALEALERERLPSSNRIHEFHVRLSDIVRHYIEDRFAIRAPELTTPEFLREAKASTAIPQTQQATLATLLKAADMVKFAAVRPDSASCETSLTTARNFVQDTAPREESR